MLINILWPDELQFCIDKVEMEDETLDIIGNKHHKC